VLAIFVTKQQNSNNGCEMELSELLFNDRKVYVEVNENRMADGNLIPLSFVWEDGSRYDIDKIADVRPAASLKAGGTGMRYTILVGNRRAFLFYEQDAGRGRWFMERR
jgi:hypothetical protein